MDNGRWGLLVWSFGAGAVERGPLDLSETLDSAEAWAGAACRVVSVVLEQERPWWERCFSDQHFVIEQPFDRGSGPAVWAGVYAIAQGQPDASVRLFGEVEGRFQARDLLQRCEACFNALQPYCAARAHRPGAETLDLEALYPFVPRLDFDGTEAEPISQSRAPTAASSRVAGAVR
jgi:hypothetical protein